MFWGDTIQHMTQGDPERRGDECPRFLPAPSPSLPTLPSLRHLLIRSLPPPVHPATHPLSSPPFQGRRQLEASETREKGAWESTDGQTDG